MPIKINKQSREFIENVPLPSYDGDSYTVISHSNIINKIKKELQNNNLEIVKEDYLPAQNGNIVSGLITVGEQHDELSFNIAFLNSYNKQKKFVIAGGSIVKVCQNGHILGVGELGEYKRVHKGSADLDANKYIETICLNAKEEFRKLNEQKELMKKVDISRKDIQHLISELYFEEDLIKDTQMSILKKEIEKPTFDYGTPENNLWSAYNNITFALKTSHPKDYIDVHQKVNKYISKQFNLFSSYNSDNIVENQYEIESTFSLGQSILV